MWLLHGREAQGRPAGCATTLRLGADGRRACPAGVLRRTVERRFASRGCPTRLSVRRGPPQQSAHSRHSEGHGPRRAPRVGAQPTGARPGRIMREAFKKGGRQLVLRCDRSRSRPSGPRCSAPRQSRDSRCRPNAGEPADAAIRSSPKRLRAASQAENECDRPRGAFRALMAAPASVGCCAEAQAGLGRGSRILLATLRQDRVSPASTTPVARLAARRVTPCTRRSWATVRSRRRGQRRRAPRRRRCRRH